MLTNVPTVKCTRAEYDFLQEERRRAIRECPEIALRAALRDRTVPFPFRCLLHIHGRTTDGHIEATITIRRRGASTGYKRRIRAVLAQPSTGRRGIPLRQIHKAS